MARLLLDENLPRRLGPALVGHYARTVGQMRWNGLRNGRLIQRAEAEFDALVTMDKAMRHQQSMVGKDLCVILLRARSNRYLDIQPLVPQLLEAIESLVPGTVVVVGNPPELGAQDP